MINWEQAIRCEQEVSRIISQQEKNGVLFDINLAHQHIRTLTDKQEVLYNQIRPSLSYVKDTQKRTCARPFDKKTGGYSKKVIKLLGDDTLEIEGPFTYVAPKISERQYLVQEFLRLGWKPDKDQYTDGGKDGKNKQPKLTIKGQPVDSLMRIKGSAGKQLAEWLTLAHRRSQIQGWINRIRPDGRLSAKAITIGTNTNRMRHNIVVNVPKAVDDVIFGKEMRSLFTVPEGYVMVGHDASGLENRMLAHYMNDPEMSAIILDGDFHTAVWDTVKGYVYSRDNTKNIEYALFYGASDYKLGTMADYIPPRWDAKRTGKEIRRLIMSGLPSLESLDTRVREASKKGYLIGLDGRRIMMRRNDKGEVMEHKALNTLLQSAGAIVMKYSMIYLDKWVSQSQLDVRKVIDMHDEAEAEVLVGHEDQYAKLAVNSIIQAGKYLKLDVPLNAEALIGNTWADVH